MSDVFGFDLADGFASGRCPICDAVDRDIRRWLDSFRREGRRDSAARRSFLAAGGFCPRHAWLLHELAAADAGAAVVDVYGALADGDLALLDATPSGRRGRTSRRVLPPRAADCPACSAAADALERKVYFLLELLREPDGCERYERSAGLCYRHLEAAVTQAGQESEAAAYLVRDWRRRLADVRRRLAEREHGSWTDVVRLYAGG